ncbi:MAG: hypothetical protein RI922_1761 [Bacteroidota bacterium]|jgi:hypothetical protein
MQTIEQSLHDTFYIRELKKRLESASKIEIKEFSDCKQLSFEFNSNGLAVSAHTFARFFGLLKNSHRPYTSTLNLICEYLGFNSYNDFCITIKSEINQALYAPRDVFETGEYSLIALEIAIANNDWNGMKTILESINKSNFNYQDLVITLGNAVRIHPLQKEMLYELNKIDNGRWLFYECYVDEDDHNNYYSNALKNYYKTSKTKPNNQLFLECFLATKAIYANQSTDLNNFNLIGIKNFPLNELHFHEISRLFELQILLDFQNKNLKKTLISQLDKICEISMSYVHYDACWIIARILKALSYSRMLKKAMDYSPFNLLVFNLFKQLNNKIESIGELIIQFVGHAYFLKKQKSEQQFPPLKIGVKHDNETNSRILIEAATASLYAKNSVKSILDNNIYSFAKQTGQTWVFELLN